MTKFIAYLFLFCIFMNFYLNIKMNKQKQLKINYPIKTNFSPKLSLWLIVIVPIVLFDKSVDGMGLNKKSHLHFHEY